MDALLAFCQTKIQFFCSWYSAGGSGPYYLWLSIGALFLLLLAIIAHAVMRRLLGHRKFRGTWYNEYQFQQLLKMTYDDQQRGHRVMRHDEMQLLRAWECDRTDWGVSAKRGSFF
ncbi:conserved protein of unknown function [Georgfuchsia toluolica]|uniref:Uncharacterized protein n=1 Tax=Georgfuchsia toluolica TaxID=424218 RepID=A0A916J2Z4_9PROT|nr:conserved protein of unknown function [Georgfuchsia toluolica]